MNPIEKVMTKRQHRVQSRASCRCADRPALGDGRVDRVGVADPVIVFVLWIALHRGLHYRYRRHVS